MLDNKYLLFGAFWDHLDVGVNYYFLSNSDYINEIYEEFNIFDYDNLRKINLASIFNINNELEINNIIDLSKKYENILINVDYIPLNNKIVIKFYLKRVKQIYFYFVNKLPNSKVYLSNNIKDLLNN